MKYRIEHTQHSKTSQLKRRSLFDWSLKHKSSGPAFSSMFPGCNVRANWSNTIFFLPLSLSSIRGRFGQVHKCVENSSGLTLAAKVIKARSLKEKVRERNPSNVVGGYCDSGEFGPLGTEQREYFCRREMFDLEKICLICLLWFVSQQRTAETFHCVCLSLAGGGEEWDPGHE